MDASMISEGNQNRLRLGSRLDELLIPHQKYTGSDFHWCSKVEARVNRSRNNRTLRQKNLIYYRSSVQPLITISTVPPMLPLLLSSPWPFSLQPHHHSSILSPFFNFHVFLRNQFFLSLLAKQEKELENVSNLSQSLQDKASLKTRSVVFCDFWSLDERTSELGRAWAGLVTAISSA